MTLAETSPEAVLSGFATLIAQAAELERRHEAAFFAAEATHQPPEVAAAHRSLMLRHRLVLCGLRAHVQVKGAT